MVPAHIATIPPAGNTPDDASPDGPCRMGGPHPWLRPPEPLIQAARGAQARPPRGSQQGSARHCRRRLKDMTVPHKSSATSSNRYINGRSAYSSGTDDQAPGPVNSAIWVLWIRWRMLCSSRWVIPGLAEGVTGWLAGRRQPVFGRPSASGEKWPALTAAGGRACQCDRAGSGVRARPRRTGPLRPTQEQHKSGSRRRPTREQHAQNGIPRHT
jgi:hypothetical protein